MEMVYAMDFFDTPLILHHTSKIKNNDDILLSWRNGLFCILNKKQQYSFSVDDV